MHSHAPLLTLLMTFDPNRTLRVVSASMTNVDVWSFFGGKLMSAIRCISLAGRGFCSTPAFEGEPPGHAEPLVEASFGPLAVSPPPRTELRRIARGGNRKDFSGKLVAKDAERTASVIVRGHDQHFRALLM